MAELTVVDAPPTVALSEPIWYGGRIVYACETPARDTIRVMQGWFGAELEYPGELVFDPYVTFPGGPTDNGIRAQWPRMDVLGRTLTMAWQQGGQNAYTHIGAVPIVTLGPTVGNWPVAVYGLEPHEAQPTTSQGVFGYLDGRWWTFDEIWQSPYAQAYPQGVLFHGWRDADGVLWLVFKHHERTVLVNDAEGTWNRFLVFTGRAEFPRGCSLPGGKVYIHAVGTDGAYRAALSPFQQLEENVPTIAIDGFVPSGIAPFTCGFAYSAFGAVRAWKRVRPVGDANWAEEPVSPTLRFASVTLVNPGEYELSMRVEGVDGVSVETGARRIITVLPAPMRPSQVVTEADRSSLSAMLNAIRKAEEAQLLAYTNARCDGRDHREALVEYRDAVAGAVALLPVEDAR